MVVLDDLCRTGSDEGVASRMVGAQHGVLELAVGLKVRDLEAEPTCILAAYAATVGLERTEVGEPSCGGLGFGEGVAVVLEHVALEPASHKALTEFALVCALRDQPRCV